MAKYDEKSKERTMKYMKEKRDKLTLNLPKGKKDEYKEHANRKGKSLTNLIVDLIEDDMKNTNNQ
ncbi:MAG: antitoxin [Oscillospiraceae bacterium]|nr:antitoxin [Oscillospiraceae bacterium]MDE7120644.1 antitoxin [Oscillospiraceae bacterium]